MLDRRHFRACYDTLAQKIDMCCNRFYSKKLLKHRMVPCNKDISVHLEGFEVPHIMDYLSRKILQKADTKFLFREPGRQSRQKPIREHFAHKGVIHKEDANDVHEFCSLYKRWMRTLAEPLIPIEVQKMLVRRILSVGPDIRSYHLQAMAELLVSGGLNLSLVCLIHCVFFLQQIVLLHHENAMNADALAGIFAIVLFKEEVDEYASRDFQTWEPILSGLSLFLEYLFTGLANSVLEEALDHSELNKKRRISVNSVRQHVDGGGPPDTPLERDTLPPDKPLIDPGKPPVIERPRLRIPWNPSAHLGDLTLLPRMLFRGVMLLVDKIRQPRS